MNSKVVVLGDEQTGVVINVSENNPDYGYFRVEQVKAVVDDSGFISRKKVTAIVPGLVEDLKSFGYYVGQEIEGKVVIEESLTPFNKKDPSRDLKIAGDTGIRCTLGGMPIYRRTKFTFDVSKSDVSIQHDNVEELRQAYAKANRTNAIAPNEDFSIEG